MFNWNSILEKYQYLDRICSTVTSYEISLLWAVVSLPFDERLEKIQIL